MRLILLVLVLMLIFSLQACGGGSDLPDEPDPEPARTTQPVDCKARPDLCM